MSNFKLTGDFYEDVEVLNEAICQLQSIIECLEKECIIRDKGKTASTFFITINDMKRTMRKMVTASERLARSADIEHYGPLSKYVRPYLAY